MENIKQARDFHKYKVWQDSVNYATDVYKVTSSMPWFEKKGLCDQLQRAVVSISSNIAEGAGHSKDADFARYLDMALGSANEVETQLLISLNVGYINKEHFSILIDQLHSIQKQLIGFAYTIRRNIKSLVSTKKKWTIKN